MERIDFLAGNEKRFAQFMSELNEKDKVALVSHKSDLDGIASAKIANRVLDADYLKFVGYDEINMNLVDELRREEIRFVVFTDLFLRDSELIKELESFAKVMVIDHHVIERDYNSERTFYINSQGYCAAYICCYLFGNLQNLDKLDWLVACASVSDWMWFKNKEWLNETYSKYNDVFNDDIHGIKKGKIWDIIVILSNSIIYFEDNPKIVLDSIGDSFGDIGELKKCSDEVQKEVDEALERFEKEKRPINGGYFWEFNPHYKIGSLISTILGTNNPSITIIIARPKGNLYYLSARRSDAKENMIDLLRDLMTGFDNSEAGGHVAAAGGRIPLKYADEFKKRLGITVDNSPQ